MRRQEEAPPERGDGPYKRRLYRALGYDTFEECCEVETEANKHRVNQLIAATGVAEVWETKVPKIPARERHARPLTALRNGEGKLDKDAIIEVWNDVLVTSGEAWARVFGRPKAS